MGNSLLDITVFGRRAALSIQKELPPRKTVTLSRLKKFREELKTISSRREIMSPQLFPEVANMKIKFQ
jgi:hypothetical protein